MDERVTNPWSGKSAEDVMVELLHQLRAPIHTVAGALSMLKSSDQLSPEQKQQVIDLALNSALRAQAVVNSISQYWAERDTDQ